MNAPMCGRAPSPARRIVIAPVVVVAFAFGVFGPPTAHGQVSVGAHGSYASEHETSGVGPRVRVDVAGAEGLSVNASLDLFFPEEGGLWGLNGNVQYSFFPESWVGPYVGAGVSYLVDSEEEVFRDLPGGGGIYVGGEESMAGVDLLGGLEFRITDGLTPFAHARYTTAGEGRYVLSGGVLLF